MSLSSTCIKRPVFATVMNIIMMLVGCIGLVFLGVRDYPSVDPPIISVSTSFPGANADVIETQITEPLESAINGIPGIRSLTSQSRDGRSNITVEFELEVDLETAANDVRDKVSGAMRRLPKDVDPPTVSMIYGGMPQIVSFSDKKKKENYLKSLFQGTYIRDIKERYNIRNDDDLNELIDIIASNIGCLTNPTNLENTFKSVKGHSISDTTIQSYLGMLQDAFMVEKAIRYDIKGKHYINTPSKYYFEDVGLRNARLNYRQIDGGHLMENIIYNELRIRGYSVDVGQVEVRTTNAEGKKIRKLLEVDFICNSGNKRMYIQSALDMPTPEKIDQETNSLRHINDGFPKIVIVGGLTPSYVNTDGISIMNVIDFLKDTEMGLL